MVLPTVDSLWICLSTAPTDFQQHLILVDMRALMQIKNLLFLAVKNLRPLEGNG